METSIQTISNQYSKQSSKKYSKQVFKHILLIVSKRVFSRACKRAGRRLAVIQAQLPDLSSLMLHLLEVSISEHTFRDKVDELARDRSRATDKQLLLTRSNWHYSRCCQWVDRSKPESWLAVPCTRGAFEAVLRFAPG